MESLFISYDRHDVDVAKRIYDTLLGKPDIEPWQDLTRLKLVEFDPECKRQIDKSSYVLALISKASLSGEGYVATEWEHTREQGKRAIPILLDDSAEDRPQLPGILKDFKKINWIRLYQSFEEGMQKLLREIYGDIAGKTFRETFSSIGTDNEGWRFDGWDLDDSDAGNQNSQSMSAEVAPSFSSQTLTCTAAFPMTLGKWSRIAYARKVMLHRANTGAKTRFEVTLSDGSHVVPIEEIEMRGSELHYDDGKWQSVEQDLDLTRLASKNVTLNFTLSGYDVIAMPLTKGKAQIDNIWID